MDSTHVNLTNILLSTMKFSDIVSAIAVLISFFAFIYSRKSYRRIEKIEEPKIHNVQTAPDFKFIIKDYSIGRNLRIDSVKVKQSKRYFYTGIKFETNNDKHPLIELRIDSLKVLEGYKFIIYTNYKKLYYSIPSYE